MELLCDGHSNSLFLLKLTGQYETKKVKCMREETTVGLFSCNNLVVTAIYRTTDI